MKIKLLFSLLLAGSLVAGAQNQGYKDGIEYYKAGQYDNAKTILERTFNDPSTDKSLADYYLGQVALGLNDKAAAQKYFQAGKDANADNAYNYVGLGALALLNGNLNEANEMFKTADKLAKKNTEISTSIARAYYNADPVKYAKEIQKYIDKARKNSKNQDPSIYVLEGDMLADQQNWGEAANRYENAITFDANNPESYVKYADAYFYVNKDYAIQKLQEYLNNHPESAMVQRELAEKNFKADRWKAASDLYGKYIQNPNHFPEDKARYAVLLYWGESYPESLKIANEILAQDPNNFLMQRVRFLDQTALGQYNEAIANGTAFFKNNPGANFTIKDYTTLAEAYSGVDQDSLAVVQYEIAAKQYPDNSDLLKNLSNIYSSNKQHAKAADAYAAYLETQEEPSLNDLYTMTGRCLNAAASATDTIQAVEFSKKGIEYINKVIDAAEPNHNFYYRKALLNIAGNNKRPNAEAIEAFDKMIEILDQDPANKQPGADALGLYKNAFAFEQAYYSIIKDEAKHAEFVEKYKEIQDIMAPKAE